VADADDVIIGNGLERYAEIKAKVIATHGLDPSDEQVNVITSLMLARERLTEAIARGDARVDYTAFTRVLDLLKGYVPAPASKVTLTVIGRGGDLVTCPECKHEFAPPMVERTLDEMRAQGSAKAKAEEQAKQERRAIVAKAVAGEGKAEPKAAKPAEPPKPYHETVIKDTRSPRPGSVVVNRSEAGTGWYGGAEKQASSYHQPARPDPHPYRNRTPYDNV